jgi:transposase
MRQKLVLDVYEKRELQKRSRSRVRPSEEVRRARMILLLWEGESYSQIEKELNCYASYINKWRKRFQEDRLAGLYPRHQGSRANVLTPQLEARILNWTRRKPTDGTTHWSSRRLAKKLGINHMLVARTWRRAGLRPHNFKRYMVSNDPEFEQKAADVIGLYMNPPQHAAVFCVDEKTAIQALDRLDPVLPLSPGRAERHGFEYYRHGTLSLYAALETSTGKIIGKTASHHTSAEFVAFLSQIVASQSKRRQIHIIADNLSAHKTKAVDLFLAENPNVRIHYTPTYSSWLNQIEIWFSKIERQLIARGIFTSVNNLSKQIMNYIRKYNQDPRVIKWTYSNPKKRIKIG